MKNVNFNTFDAIVIALFSVFAVLMLAAPQSLAVLFGTKAVGALFGWLGYVKFQQWKASGNLSIFNIEE